MKNKYLLFIFGMFAVIGIAVLLMNGNQKPVQQGRTLDKKLQIVASFYPLYFFASQIGGEKADVFNITPASAEPHDYEPTTQDVARISAANMLVLNGGTLEPWGNKIKDQLQGTRVEIVTAGDTLAKRNLNENGTVIQDPHIWQDPILAKQEVVTIEKGFEKIDPANASYFQKNALLLEKNLDQLDHDFTQGLARCQQKDFVTSHAAFGYLAARFGIQQVAISGISPDQEPTPQKLTEITDLVKKKNIKIIFFESLVSPRLSQTIAQETGAQTMVLDPIEGISDTDMKKGKTYITLMKGNLSALQKALQCSK